jgi:hypothetical protein
LSRFGGFAMSLVKLDLNPGAEKLRSFADVALAGSVALSLLGMIFYSWSHAFVEGLLLFGLLIFLAGKISHRFILPVYRLLILLSFPIGWLISHLLFAAFYYLVIFPIALLFKLTGRDSLQLKIEKKKESYWINCRKKAEKQRYFQQF